MLAQLLTLDALTFAFGVTLILLLVCGVLVALVMAAIE